jgi:tRNA modification GTPase
MFSTSDTIVAIATPPGRGGIGVVRLSGPDAHTIARAMIARSTPLLPRHATFSILRLPHSATSAFARPAAAGGIDQIVATYFPAPHSYTGDDVIELSAHGSPVVLDAIVAAAVADGARLAEPGEFTLRAFLNRRIDLPQAEAVADLIEAATPLQARAAFDQLQGTLTQTIGEIDAALFDLTARLEASIDFPDEGYHFIDPGALSMAIDDLMRQTTRLLAERARGRLLRDGLHVVIVGKPNVGKSSLFNALAGTGRAIVTDIPGTTRDLITELVALEGLRVTLVDTAGLRAATDAIEIEGVARSRSAYAVADLTIVVLDRSRPLEFDDCDALSQTVDLKRLIVVNKMDAEAAWSERDIDGAVPVSVTAGTGLDGLRRQIAAALDVDLLADRPSITNIRHIALVQRAHEALGRAREAAVAEGGALPEEFVLADLQEARAALEEISGRRTSEDVLAHIFSRFCVGK